MPGDDLLFHRLSDSTIGAVGFHGRVRNGIGWDTDAIATRQWSRCDDTLGNALGTLFAAFAGTGLKIDTVHILVASLSEHRVLVVFVVGTNPSTARGLAIWRRLNHPHYRMALLV